MPSVTQLDWSKLQPPQPTRQTFVCHTRKAQERARVNRTRHKKRTPLIDKQLIRDDIDNQRHLAELIAD